MSELQLPGGRTATYTYDARSDRLDVRLSGASAPGPTEPVPGSERLRVRRDRTTGEVAEIEVHGVQSLILEHLARDVVALVEHALEDAAVRPPDVEERRPPAPAAARPPDADEQRRPAAPDRPPDREERRRPAVTSWPPDVEERRQSTADVRPPDAEERRQPAAAARPPDADERRRPAAADDDRASRRRGRGGRGRSGRERRADTAPNEEGGRPGAGEDVAPEAADPADIGDHVTPPGFEFAGLDPALGAAVAAMGHDEPTPIQRQAIPPAMAGRDVVGLAQTGTGKTVAFLLPALQRLLVGPDDGRRPRALVVTPTRELAVQVAEQARLLARFTPLRVAAVYGGSSMPAQTKALREGADVVVATPGRLLDHVRRSGLRLGGVGMLVLDETDRMLDMGFIPDVRRIVELLPVDRQTLLFGATLPPDIESLSRRFQRDPETVEIARQLPPATLRQVLYPVGKHLKIGLLVHLLAGSESLSRVLVFAETKVETDIVARRLAAAGLAVSSMHGDRPQRDRERALSQLKSGEVQALVATNVAARGLDIQDVTHVVNYDMPQTVDDYIHRVGRTARGAEAEGTAYTFVTSSDEDAVARIEAVLGYQLPRVQAEGFDYDVPTPSWAQPSSRDLARALHPPSLRSLSRSFVRRRR